MQQSSTSFFVRRASTALALDGDWHQSEWGTAESASLRYFYDLAQAASDHRPDVNVKVLYNEEGISVRFLVKDRYVRSIRTERQSLVCLDSCVEWFVQPVAGCGYFNFEINAGGTLLLTHVYGNISKNEYHMISDEWLDRIRIHHSLPSVVDPEIQEPTTWQIGLFVPFELFRAYLPNQPVDTLKPWSCNFYKCADQTSHPHWASWHPVQFDPFGFHDPERFAPLIFESAAPGAGSWNIS